MTKVQRFGHANWCLYAPGGRSRCICGTVKYNPPIADTQSKPAPEGVAAPLEPSQPTPWDIWRDRCNRGEHTWRGKPLTQVQMEDVFEYTRAYAAAVSKNLQQSVDQLCGDVKAIQQDYTNEKKRADNLQEELARWLIRSDRKSVYGYAYAKEGELVCEVGGLAWYDTACILRNRLETAEARILELEKEIAALRETAALLETPCISCNIPVSAHSTEQVRICNAALREKP